MENNITHINKYCLEHSNQESDLLKEIREYTYKTEEAAMMITGPIVANFLKNIIRLKNVKTILEIGMFTGYSAIAMAEALPDDGIIHTCERMETHVKTARIFFNKYVNSHKLTIHEGEALESIENFSINSFDLIFIDADKINYINYYKKSMTLLKSGGIIVLDNMLWSGEVLNLDSPESKVLNDLNKIIQNDDRNYNLLLPIRDGVMMCIKK